MIAVIALANTEAYFVVDSGIMISFKVGPWKNPPALRDEGSLFPLIRCIACLVLSTQKSFFSHSAKNCSIASYNTKIKTFWSNTKFRNFDSRLFLGGTRPWTLGICLMQVIYLSWAHCSIGMNSFEPYSTFHFIT